MKIASDFIHHPKNINLRIQISTVITALFLKNVHLPKIQSSLLHGSTAVSAEASSDSLLEIAEILPILRHVRPKAKAKALLPRLLLYPRGATVNAVGLAVN